MFMSFFLFAETEPAHGLTALLAENWLLLTPPLLGFAAIYILMPKARRSKPLWGGVLAALALIIGAAVLIRTDTFWIESLLFYAFAGLAVLAGGMMITQKNPVHSALSFALVVLSTCGIFLLQAAPFLMAATIIIYAGAIVVTFLFVIMLAQQEGVSNADQRTREPFLASLAGCILLAALLCILNRTYNTSELDGMIRDLNQLTKAADDAAVKRLLGDPATAQSSDLIEKLKKFHPESEDLNRGWVLMKVHPTRGTEMVQKYAKILLVKIDGERREHGSLALLNVPGKANTPGHAEPGKLPAANVAALGKTLFTDYLIPVELAATLLLVATIGAICIAGRKTEELR
jgi:NADH-quinone oxidoreductase subunit J